MENFNRRPLDLKRIYVISLFRENHAESIERIRHLKQVLIDSGLSKYPTKIVGVNGRTVGDKYDHLLAGSFSYGHLKNMKGIKGASISHVLCYLDILKDGIEGDVLILEDDSIIHKDFLKLMPPFMPKDYHVFLAYTYSQNIYNSQNIYFHKNVKKITRHQLYSDGALDMLSYFVNGNLVKDFTEKILPIEEFIPNLLQDFSKDLNVYLVNPSLNLSGQKAGSLRMQMDEEGRDYWSYFAYPQKEKEKIDSSYEIKVRIDPSMFHEVEKTFEVYASDGKNFVKKLDVQPWPSSISREFIEISFKIPENSLIYKKIYTLEFIYKNNFSQKILKCKRDIIYTSKNK